MNNSHNASKIAEILRETYPDPKTELIHQNDMQLAIAVMLSAQTTDKKVNQVTGPLFEKYKSWDDFANADITELMRLIKQVNFHKGKADRIIKAAKVVLEKFEGHLPRKMEDLIKIPGVARKSANVIMQELWGIAEGIVVDTHVTRVSGRLGLTEHSDPVKIEKDLMRDIPVTYWRNFSGAMVAHGRYICTARKPECSKCVLRDLCPSALV